MLSMWTQPLTVNNVAVLLADSANADACCFLWVKKYYYKFRKKYYSPFQQLFHLLPAKSSDFKSQNSQKIAIFFEYSKPKNTNYHHWAISFFVVGYAFFMVCILHFKRFFKKCFFKAIFLDVNGDVNFGLTSFFWRHLLKNYKKAIFGKSVKKVLKKCVGGPNKIDISKVIPKWKFWVVDVNFWIQLHPKSQKYRIFPGETTVLSSRTIIFGTFWQSLRKIQRMDIWQIPKTCEHSQKWLFLHKWAVFEEMGKNLKNAAVLRFLNFLPLNSFQVSENFWR